MKDFDYLEKLGLDEKRLLSIIEQGQLKTAADMYSATACNAQFWGQFLYPVTIAECREVLWRLMTAEERDRVQNEKKLSIYGHVAGIISMLALGVFTFFIMGGCERMSKQLPFCR